jgi:hypothetical protein
MDLHRAAFIAGLQAMAPGATVIPTSFSVGVRAYPHTFSSTIYGPLLSFAPLAGTTDLDLGTLSYPHPYPSWFKECRVLDYIFQIQIPGALGAPSAALNYIITRVDLLPGAPSIIEPALGPARLPSIAGRDALLPQAGVGVTPVISWSAPTLGTPTRYTVVIHDLSGGALTRASITVSGNSVTIPPLVLVPGSVYVAAIVAIWEPNFDFTAPNRVTAPRDLVPLFTAPFAP